jgi:ubiquinone/menaquinone biosynthesis C-methylase UbiE
MAFGEQALSRVELGPGVRVLDVASGSGGLSIPAARAGAEVIVLDIAPTMIERLRDRARAQSLTTVQAEVGDCQALALDDDVFDVAVSMNGVSLFPDILGGLREMVRVTRPGGGSWWSCSARCPGPSSSRCHWARCGRPCPVRCRHPEVRRCRRSC